MQWFRKEWYSSHVQLSSRAPKRGGFQTGVSRSGLVLHFLSFFVLFCPFCPFLSFFVLFCPCLSLFVLVCPFLSFFVLFCPFLFFFVLFCPFLSFFVLVCPRIFPICSGMVRGFSGFVPFLFLGLLLAPTRNSPKRVRDTIWTFPEKKWESPRFGNPPVYVLSMFIYCFSGASSKLSWPISNRKKNSCFTTANLQACNCAPLPWGPKAY